MARYFGTVEAGGLRLSTGETDEPIIARLGYHDAALQAVLHPDGRFEIDVVDSFGDRVGYVVEPREARKGRRVLKGRLPTP